MIGESPGPLDQSFSSAMLVMLMLCPCTPAPPSRRGWLGGGIIIFIGATLVPAELLLLAELVLVAVVFCTLAEVGDRVVLLLLPILSTVLPL